MLLVMRLRITRQPERDHPRREYTREVPLRAGVVCPNRSRRGDPTRNLGDKLLERIGRLAWSDHDGDVFDRRVNPIVFVDLRLERQLPSDSSLILL